MILRQSTNFKNALVLKSTVVLVHAHCIYFCQENLHNIYYIENPNDRDDSPPLSEALDQKSGGL